LERSFRLILKASIEAHPSPISLTYITPGEHSQKSEVFRSLDMQRSSELLRKAKVPSSEAEESPLPSSSDMISPLDVTLQVISPTFYSRFFHYETSCTAVAGELLDHVQTRTVWASNPDLIIFILGSTATAKKTGTDPTGSNGWRWRLLSILRTAPVATNYARGTPYNYFKGLSDMDHWILEHCNLSESEDYRRAMLRVFLGERIGGTAGPLKRFSNDLEPFGLSRDAVLRIYDASIKAFLVAITVSLVKLLEGEHSIWVIGSVEWATAGLNFWACGKAYL
jgi:hypothetical protein